MPAKAPPKEPKKGQYTYKYPRAMNTVDGVVFGYNGQNLQLLLIKRNEFEEDRKTRNEFGGYWALPGGFVLEDEDLESAVVRELTEETGVQGFYFEQLYTFGNVGRDPRGRVISVAYYALVKSSDYKPQKGSDADEAEWFDVHSLPKKLAFDHAEIIEVGLQRLRGKVRYQPIGFELLPEKFTLVQLKRLYEVILGVEIHRSNFRRKILSYDVLKPLNEYVPGGRHGSQLFSFNRKAYDRLVKRGFNFEL